MSHRIYVLEMVRAPTPNGPWSEPELVYRCTWHSADDGFFAQIAPKGFEWSDPHRVAGEWTRTRVILFAHEPESRPKPRPLDEWHEDTGPVLWWKFPITEPPYVGSPLSDDWPGYHTHWTPIPEPEAP